MTNSGGAAISGATFTDALSDVLDDASYDNNAAATAGSVTVTSPNLTWTGNLAAGASATITFSVTVKNPDTGNKSLASTITSTTTGSNCASGSTDPQCTSTVTVLVPGLTITLSASPGSTTPGGTVTYTITATNSGQTPYTGATITDPLTGLLDDASYNGDATAGTGAVSFTSPNLTWTGNLATGAAVTVTFSVTVHNPDTGEKLMQNTVTSTAAGSNCAVGSTDSRCTTLVPVLVPGLTIVVTHGTSTTTPGATVTYTITATNSGQTPYTGVTFTDALGGVLDDATYNGDATASTGAVSFTSPNLTWTGDLAVGSAATITFSVTVHNPDTGNDILASTVTSATPGSNCAAGSTDARCSATVNVAVLTIVDQASPSSTTPGSVVRFTATFTNSGRVPYTGITVASDITDVVDDASPNGDQTATSGTLSLTATGISWTGDIPVGGTVTVTGTVTVHDPDSGNKHLAAVLTTTAPGSNCPSGSADARCSVSVPVLVPGLTITAVANTGSAAPGAAVHYTVTVTDSGQTAYTGATVTASLAGLLDDASYNGDATATPGSVSFASPDLTWTGDLAVGVAATITFSAEVSSPDTGDKTLVVSLTSAAAGSSCPPPGPTAGCTVTVAALTPGLTITTTASAATAAPGQQVTYTVTVTDSGQTAYTGATFADSLAGVLDDASYGGDAHATAGSVSFASLDLTWTGDLTPGVAATVTFSVTVNSPDGGDQVLASSITSATAGSNCPAGGTDPRCGSTVPVTQLLISVSADVSTATPGSVVRFTGVFTNIGQAAYTGITIATDTSDILDDATPDGDQTATSGTLTVGPDRGVVDRGHPGRRQRHDHRHGHGGQPRPREQDPDRHLRHHGGGQQLPLRQHRPAVPDHRAGADPGADHRHDRRYHQCGARPGHRLHHHGDQHRADHLHRRRRHRLLRRDDRRRHLRRDAAASTGTLSYASPQLTWTGDLAPGASVTITYTVTVNNPIPATSWSSTACPSAAAGSTCPPGSIARACRVTIAALTPALTITTTASAPTAAPGPDGQLHRHGDRLRPDPLHRGKPDRLTRRDARRHQRPQRPDRHHRHRRLHQPGPDLDRGPGPRRHHHHHVLRHRHQPRHRQPHPDQHHHLPHRRQQLRHRKHRHPLRQHRPHPQSASLTFTQSTGANSTAPGDVVSYTITVANSGDSPYADATFTDPLSGVIDDASAPSGLTATAGTVGFASPNLTWTGTVPANSAVTITFSVTVASPDTGDHTLTSTLTSPSEGSNCATGSTDPVAPAR